MIKSSKINNSKKIIKSNDSIYMNTSYLHSEYNEINKVPNIKNIIISKNVLDEEYNIEIKDSSANNIWFETFSNFGYLTIPIDYFYDENIILSLENEKNIKSEIKKINITKDNKIIKQIILENDIKYIEIRNADYVDTLFIHERSHDKIIDHYVNKEGESNKILYRYFITKNNLDKFNNLNLKEILDFQYISCEPIKINTLVADKRIFDKLSQYNQLFEQKENNPTIKNIRIIDNNEMRLIQFDKTFEIKDILLNKEYNTKYIYIKTNNDEVVLYINKDNELKYISKNDLYKEENIKNVYFRFRKQIINTIFTINPLNIIIKEYNNGEIKVLDLTNEINIDSNFKKNIIKNIENLNIKEEYLNYIKNNQWLELLNSKNFSNNLYNKIIFIHKENELIKIKANKIGLNEDAINYLKSREILEKILDKELIEPEINGYNEIGKQYKKILKK